MGMTASYQAMSPEEYAALEADREHAAEFFYGIQDFDAWVARREQQQEADGKRYSLEKDWHALHFLLTGDARMDEGVTPPPFGNVVLGGKPTPFEATYGHVRLLSPKEVQEVAAALRLVSVEELRRRFDVSKFNSLEIYPDPRPGGWDDDEIATLWSVYPGLVDFFERAAAAGNVVLLSTD
jgi:hypothetical protein